MAAAYLFHICLNNALIDGNKRTAALTALLFLDVNDVADEFLPDETELEELTLGVASGSISTRDVVLFYRRTAS